VLSPLAWLLTTKAEASPPRSIFIFPRRNDPGGGKNSWSFENGYPVKDLEVFNARAFIVGQQATNAKLERRIENALKDLKSATARTFKADQERLNSDQGWRPSELSGPGCLRTMQLRLDESSSATRKVASHSPVQRRIHPS
jgi:hypothetical protein